ncbi:MAG TPA: hypothetical protein VGL92_03535 [Acidimicrobiia bacterium]
MRSIAGALALAVLAPACERHQQAAPPPPPSTASTAGTATTAGPTVTPPAQRLDPQRNFATEDVWVLGPGTGNPKGSPLLQQVRFGAGIGYDRVVFEFEEYLTGKFSVAYVSELESDYASDSPSSDCSAPKRMAGTDLVVSLLGTGTREAPYSDSSRRSYTGRRRIRPTSTEQVREAVLFCEFEATLDWVLVVADKRPFRVTTLDGPPRLVVDVARAPHGWQRALGGRPQAFSESAS